MPWGRLDDSLYDHPKLDALGKNRLACVGLNTLAQSWCNRWLTDGLVPVDRVRKLGGTTVLADTLVAAGMWEDADGGYQIHDFLDYNDSRETVLAQRESARQRMAERRKNRNRTSGEVPPNTTGSSGDVQPPRVPGSRPGLSRPDPDPAGGSAPAGWDEPEGEALTWLANHGCYLRPGDGYHQNLVVAVTNYGVNAIVGTFDRLLRAGVKQGDKKGFVFGAIDALNGKPDLKALEREDREAEQATTMTRRVEATRRRNAEVYGDRRTDA